ncbi:protein kinase superfamily protein [Striga asiatica]|uniref:Protein kinase superfamily protein n=1 Tax=Striga asiatica TaxID=4170 RepID=A0A5A7PXF7_STRAF|nr:protein kinase superfamily protein [Striga asiatica]
MLLKDIKSTVALKSVRENARAVPIAVHVIACHPRSPSHCNVSNKYDYNRQTFIQILPQYPQKVEQRAHRNSTSKTCQEIIKYQQESNRNETKKELKVNVLANALKKSRPRKLKPTLIPVVPSVRAKTAASLHRAPTLSSENQYGSATFQNLLTND